ncbi:hypothetical protein LTR39_000497, partial [Cryomyces antarcticus]
MTLTPLNPMASLSSDTSGLPGQAQDFKSHPQSPDPLTNAPQQQQQSPLLSRASSFDSGFLLTTQMEQFRAPGRANRSGRMQIDHDVFEGLPVRQWRELEATVTAGPTIGQDNNLTPLKGAWPELPMPR